MMLVRALLSLSLLLFALAATGCDFFEFAFSPEFAPCETDENCPDEFVCLEDTLSYQPGQLQYHPGEKYCKVILFKLLRNDDDVAKIQDETTVQLDLIIDGNFSDISLPNLEEIGGSLIVAPGTLMTSLSLPRLKTIEGGRTDPDVDARPGFGLAIVDATVTSVSLPELKTVGSAVSITQVSGLQTLELPLLDDVGSVRAIATDSSSNFIADSLDLESFRDTTLRIDDNPDLQSFALPALRGTLSHVVIEGNPRLQTVDLQRWEGYDRGGDDFDEREQSWLTVRNNPQLNALELAGMQYAERLQIEDNDALETIDLTALKGVYGNILIRRNLALTEIDIDPDLAEDFTGGLHATDCPLVSCPDLDVIADAFSPAYVYFENLQGVCAVRTPIVTDRAQAGACVENAPAVDVAGIYLDTLDGAEATFDETWDDCFDVDDTNVDIYWRLPDRPAGTVWTATRLNLGPVSDELVQLTFVTAPGCVAASATCLESTVETDTDVEHTVEDGEGPLFLIADGRLFDLESADIVREIAVTIAETAP